MKPTSNTLLDIGSMNSKEAVTQRLAEFTREDLLIGIPARVTSTKDYETRQVISVEIVISDQWIDGRVISPVQLDSIFVQLPTAGGYSLEFPVATGDLVALHYTHRAISDWLDGDGSTLQQPIDFTATLRDCYATLGFGTRKANLKPSKTDFVLRGPETTITITPSGVVTVVTKGDINATTDAKATVTAVGDITLNSDANVIVNSTGNTEVNSDGDATITTVGDTVVNSSGKVELNGTTIENNGATFKVVTTGSINPLTGTPFPAGSATLLNVDG